MDTSWIHPFSAIIAGPSGCGKSCFVLKFIQHLNEMCSVKFDEVYWHYSEWQSMFNTVKAPVTFKEGLPEEDLKSDNPKLIIIDDLMRESDNKVVDLFTKGCHHRNISVFFLTQNIFHQGKGQRDISLNAHYLVYFKNPRDRAQIQHLARQICPENSKFLQEAYKDATSLAHGYLLIDLKQSTPDDIRYRTCIFPTDQYNFVYIPKKK